MLYRIEVDSPATTQAICVTPTRELAIQIVDKAIRPMAANMVGLKIELAIAGSDTKRVDAHLIVGTPGKVVDWLKRKTFNASTIKVFVLDEADNMVDEGGHRANSLLIKKYMPRTCQSLFFSATFPIEVVQFASRMVEKPDKILIEDGPEFLVRTKHCFSFGSYSMKLGAIDRNSHAYPCCHFCLCDSHLTILRTRLACTQVLDVIKQLWIDTRGYPGRKLEFLADIYSLLTIGQSIIFVETKRSADMVHQTLSDAGYTCSVLHGSIEPALRDATMEAFRNGESNVLITTNVLARGVDVDNVCLVINYDPPTDRSGEPDFETYLHRIGRTGRFGRKGTAISLIDDQKSIEVLARIEQHFARDGKEMIAQADADPEKLADVIEI